MPTSKKQEEIEWEVVSIVFNHLDLSTRVAINLEEEMKDRLVLCLTNHSNIIAWSPQEVKGISLNIMEYLLNIFLDAKLIKQKKRYFSSKKDKIIYVKIDKLLKAGHLSNPFSHLVG